MTGRATTPREWAVAIAGGLALAAGLVWVLRGGDEAPIVVPPAPNPVRIAVPAPAPPVVLPAETGDYRLRGVLARPGGGGSAIIESADGRQRLVREGAEVGPGVRLVAVNGDGVVLERGGVQRKIGFAKS